MAPPDQRRADEAASTARQRLGDRAYRVQRTIGGTLSGPELIALCARLGASGIDQRMSVLAVA